MADIKRVNYFTHQFLVEKDFDDEQTYHIDMRRRHNRVYHSWGVAEGLDVSKTADKEVTISSGTAIDKHGQEIVLESRKFNLTAFGSNAKVYLTVAYQEVFDEADHYTSGGVDNYTRTTERPEIEGKTAVPPGDGLVITLARVHLDGSGNVVEIANSVRTLVGSKIAPGAVSTDELADGAVKKQKIANNAVSNRTIQNNAVTSTKIAVNAVTAAKIANGQVGTSELANSAITNTKIANNAVNASKIQDGSVGNAELTNNAVTNTKIANDAVTAAKIANGQVGTSELANSAITNTKIANNAVNASKIQDGSVGNAELTNNAVTNTKIANDAVTAAKIANGQVGTSELANNAVNAAKLANNAVSILKLETKLAYNGTYSVSANAIYNLNLGESDDEHAFYLVSVYCITLNAKITWEWITTRFLAGGKTYFRRRVVVKNLTNITASFRAKIYHMLET